MVATGDELVDIDKPIKTYQTRLSNAYALQSLFHQNNLAETSIIHLPDNKKVLLARVSKIIAGFDIVVLTGGVSMGEFDFVPQVLTELKVKALFHKVVQIH